MKILKITNCFPEHWSQFMEEHPELQKMTWAQQQVIVNENWFGYPHIWKYVLEPLGYELVELLPPAKLLQETWAKEHGLRYDESNWRLEILKAQIIYEKPDILFVASLFVFPYLWLKEIREKCPSIKLIMGWYGAPLKHPSVLKACDLVLSCIPEAVEQLRSMGHQSEHINHSFDRRIPERLTSVSEPKLDFTFIGSIRRKSLFDIERDALLETLASQIDIKIFSSAALKDKGFINDVKAWANNRVYSMIQMLKTVGVSETFFNRHQKFKKLAALQTPPLRPVNPKLRPYLRPPVYGLKMFQTLRNSRATFHKHIDISYRSASSMRLFEATGAGTCLVTDHKENIHELFEPDKEVVTYRCAEECIEKVKWLMEHPNDCEAIAQSGQARTLQDHTLNQRATVMDSIIKSYFKVR